MIEFEAVIKQSRIDKGMQPFVEPILLDDQDGIEITKYIASIAHQEKLRIIAYNICQDHVHLLLVCKESERDLIVQKLKSISSRKYNINHGNTQGQMAEKQGVTITQRQGVMTPC
ncbi:MAG: transposase [bacterium]|nr:transposase [bacterium]